MPLSHHHHNNRATATGDILRFKIPQKCILERTCFTCTPSLCVQLCVQRPVWKMGAVTMLYERFQPVHHRPLTHTLHMPVDEDIACIARRSGVFPWHWPLRDIDIVSIKALNAANVGVSLVLPRLVSTFLPNIPTWKAIVSLHNFFLPNLFFFSSQL